MAEEVQEKLRIRTEEELKGQAKGLAIVRNILEDHDIACFIAGGTLLGMIREGDFIKWDWDVEINVRTEEARPKFNQLINTLKKQGFVIVKYDEGKENFKIAASIFGTKYEIIGYYLNGQVRMRKRYQMPAYLFKEGRKLQLRGETYDVLNPPEEYLAHTYGDWKTPLRTTNKEDYMTESFHREIEEDKKAKGGLKEFFGTMKKKVFKYF
jgi:phosphorylcholine metabolism protein LicD